MRSFLIAGALAALTVAATGSALAQTPAPSPARADRAAPVARAAYVDARVARLVSADADRDGAVTREERRAAGQARRAERQAARFDRLDANDDGVLSRAEFDAGAQARDAHGARPARARHASGSRRPHAAHAGRRAEARGPVVIAEARAKAEQAFDRMDSDHDGVLTVQERRAARRAMREHVAERRAARPAREASPPAPASE